MIKWVSVFALDHGACYNYKCTLCGEKISVNSACVSDYQSSLFVKHFTRTHICDSPLSSEQDCAGFSGRYYNVSE